MHTELETLRTQKCEQNPKMYNNEYWRNNRFCHFLKFKSLIEDCLHEGIYCRLPALGLRANDALTQSAYRSYNTHRNELPVKCSLDRIWLDSFSKSHSSNAHTTGSKLYKPLKWLWVQPVKFIVCSSYGHHALKLQWLVCYLFADSNTTKSSSEGIWLWVTWDTCGSVVRGKGWGCHNHE